MAAPGNLSIQGNINNLPTGTQTFGPTVISAPNSVGQSVVVALSSGNNTVSLPTGVTSAIIMGPQSANPAPNPSYGGKLTLKGVAGDTGVTISAQWPTVLSWDTTNPAPSSVVIAATVATSVQIWMM